MKVDVKSIIGVIALSSLSLSVVAGGSQAWKQTQEAQPNSALEQNVRDWAAIDVDKDNLISPAEMTAFLKGHTANKAISGHEQASEAGSVSGDRTLSSTELGMHFTHGPGKDSQSTKVLVPGTTYTVESPVESSNHQSFNKREMAKELQEASLEQEAKPKM
ncbi:MAG: hypothetical protein ACKVQA_22035 [Burkholderiales bacterium]